MLLSCKYSNPAISYQCLLFNIQKTSVDNDTVACLMSVKTKCSPIGKP